MFHKSTVAAAGFLCQPFLRAAHDKFTAELRKGLKKSPLSPRLQELPRGKKGLQSYSSNCPLCAKAQW